MRIGKPWRTLLQSAIAGALMGFGSVVGVGCASAPWRWAVWASLLPLSFPVYLASGFLVDSVDHWLRRVTRDPLWLMTDEGRRWLQSRR